MAASLLPVFFEHRKYLRLRSNVFRSEFLFQFHPHDIIITS
jgi:hypothetical protein